MCHILLCFFQTSVVDFVYKLELVKYKALVCVCVMCMLLYLPETRIVPITQKIPKLSGRFIFEKAVPR